MPTTTFLESGTASTFGLEFWAVNAGSVSSDATTVHTGPRSLKITGGGAHVFSPDGVLADTGRRISAYVFVDSYGSGAPIFLLATSGGSAEVFRLHMDSAGVLRLQLDVFTFVNGPTLPLNAWHRISMSYTITSATVYHFTAYLDGGSAWSATGSLGTLNNTGTSALGLYSDSGINAYYSDISVDNGSDFSDPGDLRVTAKLPATVNTGNFDTTLGTGAVNERPISEANGMEDTTLLGDQQNYTLQTLSVGDVDLTGQVLVSRAAWIWSRVSVASVSAKIMDNGSESAIALTTTSALYTLLTTSASYPSNVAGIGMRSSTTPNTFLFECGTLIAFTPPIPLAFAEGTPILRSRMRTW